MQLFVSAFPSPNLISGAGSSCKGAWPICRWTFEESAGNFEDLSFLHLSPLVKEFERIVGVAEARFHNITILSLYLSRKNVGPSLPPTTVRFHLRDASMAFDLNWLEKVMVQQLKSQPFRAWKAPLCYVVNNLDGPAAKKEETQPLWPRAARRNRCAVVFAALWCRLKSWPQKASRTVSDRQLIPCRSPNICMVRTKTLHDVHPRQKQNKTSFYPFLFQIKQQLQCGPGASDWRALMCRSSRHWRRPWLLWRVGSYGFLGKLVPLIPMDYHHFPIFFPLKLPFWGIHGYTPFLDKPSFFLALNMLLANLSKERTLPSVLGAELCLRSLVQWLVRSMAHWRSTCLSLFNSARPVAATLNATICNDMQRTKQHSNKENWQVSVELSRSDQPSASCHGTAQCE